MVFYIQFNNGEIPSMKTKFGILYVHHSILNPRAELLLSLFNKNMNQICL